MTEQRDYSKCNVIWLLKRAKNIGIISDGVIQKVKQNLEEDYVPRHELMRANEENDRLQAELKDVEMHLETFRDERDSLMKQNKTLRAELEVWKNRYGDEREFTGEESYEQSIRCKGG